MVSLTRRESSAGSEEPFARGEVEGVGGLVGTDRRARVCQRPRRKRAAPLAVEDEASKGVPTWRCIGDGSRHGRRCGAASSHRTTKEVAASAVEDVGTTGPAAWVADPRHQQEKIEAV